MESLLFMHTALFKAEKGWNELHIKITLNKTYTIRFTENGPDYEKEETSCIDNIIYFPSSLIQMISATGEHAFSNPSHLCHFITKLCTTTLENDMRTINTTILSHLHPYREKISMLEYKLDDAILQIERLKNELALSNKQNEVLDTVNFIK